MGCVCEPHTRNLKELYTPSKTVSEPHSSNSSVCPIPTSHHVLTLICLEIFTSWTLMYQRCWCSPTQHAISEQAWVSLKVLCLRKNECNSWLSASGIKFVLLFSVNITYPSLKAQNVIVSVILVDGTAIVYTISNPAILIRDSTKVALNCVKSFSPLVHDVSHWTCQALMKELGFTMVWRTNWIRGSCPVHITTTVH